MNRLKVLKQILFMLFLPTLAMATGQWDVFEMSFESKINYDNPFMDVQVDVVFEKDGTEWKQPAFWDGGKKWTVRFAFPEKGEYFYRVICSDAGNRSLNENTGTVDVTEYKGDNQLVQHGMLRISDNKRYFEHADGKAFLWLGDTQWKCLSKRLSFEEFKELTDDRAKKGFSLVQIVCGPYPDEEVFSDWWDNEGGKPYFDIKFTKVNLDYFKYADQRIKYIAESGMVPAIVGAWGRGDCDAMREVGLEGLKRHWRHLIARYGAYMTVWIVGGESGGDPWKQLGRYVRSTDPYDRPVTVHPWPALERIVDPSVINFYFLLTEHGRVTDTETPLRMLDEDYNREPRMPVLIGEHSYEEHMKMGPPYIQRNAFWGSMLRGAAGITYGAAGVWSAAIEGFPASVMVYDWTTWREGMNYPGSDQVGLGRKFLINYPWEKFEPHPEWADSSCYAAGIPGEIRMIYRQRPAQTYDWTGIKVYDLEKDVPYHVFFFDPSTGRKFDWGFVKNTGELKVLFEDDFDKPGLKNWRDDGTKTKLENGKLVTGKGSLVVLKKDFGLDYGVSVDAKSDADVGILLNYTDKDNYLVATFSKNKKTMCFYDVKDGKFGSPLSPYRHFEIGPDIHLTASVCDDVATFMITDGKRAYLTSVKVEKNKAGKIGLWHYDFGDRQEYDNFKVLKVSEKMGDKNIRYQLSPDVYDTNRLPSPQDWVLVIEKLEK